MVVEKKYFIYKYEWDDGSIYIGQSHIGANRYGRKAPYKDSPRVYNKMKKYPNFSKEIVRDKLTEFEVDDFEKYYIEYYNSFKDNNPKGLNLTKGGIGRREVSDETKNKLSKRTKEFSEKNPYHHCKILLQYDLQGNFIKEWTGFNSIKEKLDISETAIRKSISENRPVSQGYIWKYFSKNYPKKIDTIGKIIVEDVIDNKIYRFYYAKHAASFLNIREKDLFSFYNTTVRDRYLLRKEV